MILDNINVTGVTCDSRKVKEGYAFVAIKGQEDDGNKYIDDAINNGASIIYTENKRSICNIPIKTVKNSRKKLAELLNEFYDFPSKKMFLIGVTGTNGKTTTTHLINEIFKRAGYKTGLIGTVGIKMNDEKIKSHLTTPAAEELFSTLDNFVKDGIQVAIIEVSSHGLKFHRTHGLEFDVAIHTNIEKDHMNIHKNIDDYINTKKKLFDSLSRNKIAIINIDDENGVKLIKNNKRVLVLTYGLNSKASLTASSLKTDDNIIQFNLCLQRGITTMGGLEIEPFECGLTINLLGKHNIYNVLAAISASLFFGIDIEIIKDAVSNFNGVSRRLQKIYDKNYIVLDDFCHNPASYNAVLNTVLGLNYNKVIIVNAIRGNRGIEVNRDNIEIIIFYMSLFGQSKLILSLSNDIVSKNNMVREEELLIYKRVLNRFRVEYELYSTLKKSIHRALEVVNKNDIILLLGAQGMDKGKKVLYSLQNKNNKKKEILF